MHDDACNGCNGGSGKKEETPKRNVINEWGTITDRQKEVCGHLNYGILNECVQMIKYGFNG